MAKLLNRFGATVMLLALAGACDDEDPGASPGTGGVGGSAGSGGGAAMGGGAATGGSMSGGSGGTSGSSGTGGGASGGAAGSGGMAGAAGASGTGAAGSGGMLDGGTDAPSDAGVDACGGAEICDGLDNNCNGVADEGLWTPGMPIPIGPASVHAKAPAITRKPDGSFFLAAGNGSSYRIWDLDASFQVQSGPAVKADLDNIPRDSPRFARLATNGSSLITGAFIVDAGTGGCAFYYSAVVSMGADVNSLGNWIDLNTAHTGCSLPGYPTMMLNTTVDLDYNGSNYVLAWSDRRSGSSHAYITTATPAGLVGAAQPAGGTIAASAVSPESYPAAMVHVAAGGGKVWVGWNSNATGATRPRFVRLDSSASSVELGPIDLMAAPADHVLVDLALNGSALALMTRMGADVRVFAVSTSNAAPLGSQTFPGAQVSDPEPRLSVVGSGFMATRLNATTPQSIRMGWAPADMSLAFSSADVLAGSNATSGTVAAITATSAVLTFTANNQVNVVPLTCGP